MDSRAASGKSQNQEEKIMTQTPSTPEPSNLDAIAHAWASVDRVAHDLLTPIETATQYQQALAAVDELMTRVGDSAEQPHPLETLLGILIERVAAYEDATLPVRARRPEAVLAYLMADRRLTQTALAAATGIDQSTISKLLKGERGFSTAHIKALADYFGLERGVFL